MACPSFHTASYTVICTTVVLRDLCQKKASLLTCTEHTLKKNSQKELWHKSQQDHAQLKTTSHNRMPREGLISPLDYMCLPTSVWTSAPPGAELLLLWADKGDAWFLARRHTLQKKGLTKGRSKGSSCHLYTSTNWENTLLSYFIISWKNRSWGTEVNKVQFPASPSRLMLMSKMQQLSNCGLLRFRN